VAPVAEDSYVRARAIADTAYQAEVNAARAAGRDDPQRPPYPTNWGAKLITPARILMFPGIILCALAVIPFTIFYLICLVRFCFRPNLVISIKNKMGSGDGPVDIRRKTIKSEATGFSEVMPTEETELAIREIGAIINDIQKLGDHGVKKWTV